MTELTRANKLTAPTRDTHASWTANNPVLPEGVLAITKDRLYTGSVEYMIGDGVTAYTALAKFGAAGKIYFGSATDSEITALLKPGDMYIR